MLLAAELGESTPVLLTVGSLVAVALTLLGAGITWGRLTAKIGGLESTIGQLRNDVAAAVKGLEDELGRLESWLHERDAQANSRGQNHEIRLYRLEDHVGVTSVSAVPRHVVQDPTPVHEIPTRPIGRARVTKPPGGT